MALGMPVSQDFGAFQGRTEAFSLSAVLAQPAVPSSTEAKQNTNKKDFRALVFMMPDSPG